MNVNVIVTAHFVLPHAQTQAANAASPTGQGPDNVVWFSELAGLVVAMLKKDRLSPANAAELLTLANSLPERPVQLHVNDGSCSYRTPAQVLHEFLTWLDKHADSKGVAS